MHEYKPSSVFGFAVNGLMIFTSIWTIIYGHKYSFVTKISGGYLIIAVLMVVLPFVTQSLDAGPAFAADMSILFLFGLVGGVVQASTFALGGILPGKYMGAIMFGQGISGISINLVRAICLIVIPDNSYLGALIYFSLAALILLFSAFANWKFQHLAFVKYYIQKANDEKQRSQRRVSGVNDFAPGEINKSLIKGGGTERASGNYLP